MNICGCFIVLFFFIESNRLVIASEEDKSYDETDLKSSHNFELIRSTRQKRQLGKKNEAFLLGLISPEQHFKKSLKLRSCNLCHSCFFASQMMSKMSSIFVRTFASTQYQKLQDILSHLLKRLL